MKLRDGFILVLMAMCVPIFSLAQDTPPPDTDSQRPAPAPALSGVLGIDAATDEGGDDQTPEIPALLGGPKMSLALGGDAERSNYLRGGLNVGAAYEDNALMTSTQPVGNVNYTIYPSIGIDQTRSRMRWSFNYAAGLTVAQRLSNHDQASHDLSFESQFRLSPHVSLRVAEDFSVASGFFDSGTAGGGVSNGDPNVNLITPLSSRRSSSSVAEINYHFALKDLIGASGSFDDLHFSNAPTQFTLSNTRTASASAFWLHGFGRDWAGVSYSFDRLTYDPNGETRVHTILLVDTVKLPGRFTVTGFFGPEYSINQGLVPLGGGLVQDSNFSQWSYSGGAEAGWQRARTSVGGGFSRRIRNGSGVLGAVRLQTVHGDVRQQLLPGWAVAVSASYGSNHTITATSADSAASINTASLGAFLDHDLGRRIALRVGYSYDYQNQMGTTNSAVLGPAHRNRVFVTVGYQWSRPLGR